ncbi:hypothetical protein ACFOEY_11600 [Paracandidimonas soli]
MPNSDGEALFPGPEFFIHCLPDGSLIICDPPNLPPGARRRPLPVS